MLRFNFEGKIQYLSIERYTVEILLLLVLFLVLEWNSRENEHPITGKFTMLKAILIITAIFFLGVYSNPSNFIYFQF